MLNRWNFLKTGFYEGINFGVVTSFEFRLHDVGPEVMLCAPFFPDSAAGEALRFYRDFRKTAPDELTSMPIFWSVPRVPDFPAELHGEPVIILMAVYAGPVEHGETVVQPLREFATPIVDLSGPIPYTALQQMFDPFFPKGEQLLYWKSLFLNDLSDEVIDAALGHMASRPPKTVIPFWDLRGAMQRVTSDATAFGSREAPYLLSVDTTWDDPAESERNVTWTQEFWKSMKQFSHGGVYFNFPGFMEEREEMVRSRFAPNVDRLVELKNRYDPTNLFQLNQNIKPTMAEPAAD